MGAPRVGKRLLDPDWFNRFLLPGLAFKAVVIGGGYATGRELAEFFLPHGPWGGLAAMALAMALWSAISAVTFALAFALKAFDYRSFFKHLLGPGWIAFEAAYLLTVIVMLAVFGASASAIGVAIFAWPPIAGSLLLGAAIMLFAAFGAAAIERLFKYVSLLLYGVYALFVVFSLTSFGDLIVANFHVAPPPTGGWPIGGVTYAGYNIIGAVIVLPVLRHLTRPRDAVVAGALAGPLAMLPAAMFFTCMVAFYPGIARETLPSDFLLRHLDRPAFHLLFQVMIFAALLESGAGSVHAINERVSAAMKAGYGRELPTLARAGLSGLILVLCIFIADRIGLVGLIANGYRLLAYAFLLIYVAPVLVIGLARLRGLATRPGRMRGDHAGAGPLPPAL